jgi:c(7)-type cytochrome triheme protein
MSRRWIVLAIILLVGTPSALYARWIKDKVTMETEEVGKVEFSHFIHLEAVGKSCPACHNEIYHIVTKNNPAFTMKEMEAGKACGACHNGKKAFSVKEQCDSCHGNGTVTYDTDAGKATFSHKIHTAAFECASCHPTTFKAQKGTNKATMEQMEKGASCGACHDGSTAFSVKDDKFCDKCHEM